MSKLNIVTAETLPAILASGTVLVDFGAPWCGPCKALEPLLEKLGEEMADRLTVVKVDVDATPDLAAELGVMSVPTLMLFRDGKKVAGRTGAPSASQLRELVESAL